MDKDKKHILLKIFNSISIVNVCLVLLSQCTVSYVQSYYLKSDHIPSNYAQVQPDPRFARSTEELVCSVGQGEEDRIKSNNSKFVSNVLKLKKPKEGSIGCCPDEVNGILYGPGKICCGGHIKPEIEGTFCCEVEGRVHDDTEENRLTCRGLSQVSSSETKDYAHTQNLDTEFNFDPKEKREDEYQIFESYADYQIDYEGNPFIHDEKQPVWNDSASKITNIIKTTPKPPMYCPEPSLSTGHELPTGMLPRNCQNTPEGNICEFKCPLKTTILEATGKGLTCEPNSKGFWQGNLPQCCMTSGCPNDLKIDFYFIIDSSSSIGETNFGYIKDYINQLIFSLPIGQDRVRIGMTTYNSQINEIFRLNELDTKEQYLSAVRNIKYSGKGTNTGAAIYHAAHIGLSEAHGDRPDVPNFIILLTDGRARDSKKKYNVKYTSPYLHKKGTIVAIGVGDKVRKNELKWIAGPEGQVFMVQDFRNLGNRQLRLTGQNLCPSRCLREGDEGIYYTPGEYGDDGMSWN